MGEKTWGCVCSRQISTYALYKMMATPWWGPSIYSADKWPPSRGKGEIDEGPGSMGGPKAPVERTHPAGD